MLSDDHPSVSIRPLLPTDRAAVAEIVASVGNFNQAEISCALELIDIYLHDKAQLDYRVLVAEKAGMGIGGYVCWGPIPLTRGAYDLYWIATHPRCQGEGFGTALVTYVESKVREENGRLLVLETSSKESYGKTIDFYSRRGYEQASRISDFYDVGDDKLVFVKRLARQGDRFQNGKN